MRRRSRVIVSTELLHDDDAIDDISAIKSKGPEFIVNSSRPAEQFDIVDPKVRKLPNSELKKKKN